MGRTVTPNYFLTFTGLNIMKIPVFLVRDSFENDLTRGKEKSNDRKSKSVSVRLRAPNYLLSVATDE